MSERTVSPEMMVRRNTLGDLPRRARAREPRKTAMIYRSTVLDWEAFDRRVDAVASGLLADGLQPGEHVSVVARNSLDFAVLAFAVARMGGVLVPLNWALTPRELRSLLTRGEVAAVAAQAEFAGAVDEAVDGLPGIRLRLAMDGDGDPPVNRSGWVSLTGLADSHRDAEPVWAPVTDDDLAQILFTSGTEAEPKGVMLTHRAILDQSVSIIVAGRFAASDTVLHALPFYHSAQLNAFLMPFVYLGGTSVILDRPTPDAILEMVERHRVTELFSPPTVWIALLRSPRFEPDRLRSLVKAVTGAAAMPVEILKELGQRLPWMALSNLYGLTEVAPFALGLEPEQQTVRPGAVGKAGINVTVAIMREDGRLAETGEEGEIVLRTSHATLGYWKDPERTAELFAGGWLHTGDIGVMDAEGYVTVVDRKKDVIKSGGVNISSREIEDVLYEHPDVEECAVIGVPHPYWIEAVVAVVKPRVGRRPDPESLEAFCRERLAPFKVPKAFVFRDSLPKNPSGKILKRDLRQEVRPFDQP